MATVTEATTEDITASKCCRFLCYELLAHVKCVYRYIYVCDLIPTMTQFK